MISRRARIACLIVVPILAMLLTLSSLSNDFWTDDYFFLAAFRGFPGFPEYAQPPMQTFVFSDGDAAHNRRLMDRGAIPWWGDPGAKLAFWRPLASWSHWLDFRLWGDNAIPMHAHNVLLYGLVCLLACATYLRIQSSAWAALLGGLIFAVNESNGMTVGWLSARNTLMAACFGLATVLAHDRWRRDRSKPAAILAPAFFALGLLCGEWAVGAGAYLLAYALVFESGRKVSRLLTLAPYVVVGLAWLVTYKMAGFGAAGTAWYRDPLGDPISFAKTSAIQIPLLLFGQWLVWPGFIFNVPSPYKETVFLAMVGVLLLIGAALRPLLSADPRARFWFLGSLLALVPVAGVSVQARLLMLVAIGSSAVIGQFLSAWMNPRQGITLIAAIAAASVAIRAIGAILPLGYGVYGLILPVAVVLLTFVFRYGERQGGWLPNNPRSRVFVSLVAGFWILAHLMFAPNSIGAQSMVPGARGYQMNLAYDQLPQDQEVTKKTLIVLQTPSDFTPWYFMISRSARGLPLPGRLRVLASGLRTLTVERTDASTLVLEQDGGFIANPRASVYRGETSPMRPGDSVQLAGLSVNVLDTENGWPAKAAFRFDRPLDDPTFIWYTCAPKRQKMRTGRMATAEAYTRVAIPAIGEKVPLRELIDRAAAPADG